MMVVPPPSATIVSCVSPPEADRGEKTAAKPIPVIKTSRATRYLLGNFTSPGMFCLFRRSFAGVKHRQAKPPSERASVLAWRGRFLEPLLRAKKVGNNKKRKRRYFRCRTGGR